MDRFPFDAKRKVDRKALPALARSTGGTGLYRLRFPGFARFAVDQPVGKGSQRSTHRPAGQLL